MIREERTIVWGDGTEQRIVCHRMTDEELREGLVRQQEWEAWKATRRWYHNVHVQALGILLASFAVVTPLGFLAWHLWGSP